MSDSDVVCSLLNATEHAIDIIEDAHRALNRNDVRADGETLGERIAWLAEERDRAVAEVERLRDELERFRKSGGEVECG